MFNACDMCCAEACIPIPSQVPLLSFTHEEFLKYHHQCKLEIFIFPPVEEFARTCSGGDFNLHQSQVSVLSSLQRSSGDEITIRRSQGPNAENQECASTADRTDGGQCTLLLKFDFYPMKGVLHLLPKISMFCALSQNYQHLLEK